MKLVLSLFLINATFYLMGCEQRPLTEIKSLREMYGLEELLRLQKQGSTKLFMFNHAIAHDDVEALRILFSYGKNNERIDYKDLPLSQRDPQDNPIFFSQLHLAAQFGAEKVARFCLDYQTDINSTTTSRIPEYHQNTPAHIAVMYAKHEILRLLLVQHQARLDILNGDGKTIEALAQDKKDDVALSIINEAKNKTK